jgi:hypothetical protein
MGGLVCIPPRGRVGWAQKPLAASSFSVAFAAYVLPDGKLPTLCITDNGPDTSTPGEAARSHGCDACRLAATILLPLPPEIGAVKLAYAYDQPVVGQQVHLVQRLYPPSSGPRAPPYTVL